MPTITIPSFNVTVEQETKARAWCDVIQRIEPKQSLEDYMHAEVIRQVSSGIREMERPPDKTIWDGLTDDQRARIKAIVNE